MSTPLKGKIALVTGGGRGIGRGIALALAKLGADVAITARSTEQIDMVAAELHALGVRSLAVPADVSLLADVERVVQTVAAQLGRIDILINNAGTLGTLGPLEATDPATWALTQQVNVVAPYAFIRATYPAMKANGYGRVINIGSGVARDNGKPRMGGYSVSKAALDMLSRHTGTEIDGTGVTVNSVYPGVVDTAMIAHIRAQPADTMGPMKDRFDRMAADGTLSDAERVGWMISAVVLSDKNAAVMDVRNIGDELWAILDAHGVKVN
jgi:NAD(P)-dependent dehydrogenase (short-subunit alcohol dehydrogenase family)